MPLSSFSHGNNPTTKNEESFPSPLVPSPSPSLSPPFNPHTLTIENPTFQTAKVHQALRSRASTSPHRHSSTSFSTKVRSEGFRQPPLQLHLPSTAIRASQSPETLPTLAESPSEKPSAPIDIPARKKAPGQVSRPTTPLTARAPQGEHFSAWHRMEPRISESLTPYYSSRTRNPSENQENPAAQKSFATPRSESSRYRPSSPLSSQMPVPLPSIHSTQKPRLPPQSLNLAGLPKYHPANFPPRGSSPAPPSPLSPRPFNSQIRPSRGSDAKQKLVQYQRDIVNDAAKSSRSLASSNLNTKPRLNPRASPGGPITPLVLEPASDYLAAGSGSLPAGFQEGDGREFVERLVRRENERGNHPEARSGSVSPAISLSPAVSPAGVRG